MQQQNTEELLLFHKQFLLQMLDTRMLDASLYPSPSKIGSAHDNKDFSWSICMIVKYGKDLMPQCGSVYSFAGTQFVLLYRFGDVKLNNKTDHETKTGIPYLIKLGKANRYYSNTP